MNKEKKRDIVELIRVSSMQPEQLDPTLPMLVRHAVSGEVNPGEAVALVKKRILSDAFIEKFLEPFDEILSHEEIKQLISFYKSEAMRKFSKNGQKLFNPIYEAYRHLIQEVVA